MGKNTNNSFKMKYSYFLKNQLVLVFFVARRAYGDWKVEEGVGEWNTTHR